MEEDLDQPQVLARGAFGVWVSLLDGLFFFQNQPLMLYSLQKGRLAPRQLLMYDFRPFAALLYFFAHFTDVIYMFNIISKQDR